MCLELRQVRRLDLSQKQWRFWDDSKRLQVR